MALLTTGQAAFAVLANSLSAKLYMSAGARIPMQSMEKAERAAYLAGPFVNVSGAQLNEAEWAPYLASMLLYLHLKGVEVPYAGTVAAASQIVYFWGRVFTGKALPAAPMGALPRYAATASLLYSVWGTL